MIKPYYDRDGYKLYLGNCLDVLKETQEKMDMIFADPPYNLSNNGFTCHSGKRAPVNKGEWDVSKGIEEDFNFHLRWIKSCKKVLKPNGTIWISGTYHSIYACGYALQVLGYKMLNDIAWFKPNAAPNLSCRYFTASHETLLWAIKDPEAKHTFNYNLMKEGDWSEDSIKKPKTQMRSVWAIHTPKPEEKKHGKHPTQKPELLLKRIILASTNEGDLILDPFTGSSTTGLVAYKYKRRFIGIDNEKEYLDLSIRRFEDLKKR
ncbi:MAG: site-specific DNA-methyltransferase [Methanomicrobia archaeon]|nr:site-specific DNA-methyltransferase [Methanomicrobia archaeon]